MGKKLKWIIMVFSVVSVTLVTVMNTLVFAAATTTTYHSTDVPKGIIDGGTITSVIVVPPRSVLKRNRSVILMSNLI